MSLIPDLYLNSILSIGVKQNNTIKWVGTGFLIVRELEKNKYQPFMVTNKHVIENENTIFIRLKRIGVDELVTIDVPIISEDRRLYSVHPDPNIDIAVILLVGSYFMNNNLELTAFDIDKHALTSSEYIDEGGGEGSGVFMLGYPLGLVDIDSNSPICRAGCVARMNKKEINRTKNILLDLKNFPGNSGSPIVTKPEMISIVGTKAFGKCELIGIIHAYLPYQELLISSQTGRTVEIRSENSGIAVANPVEYIREVVDIEMRRMIDNKDEIDKEDS